VKHDRCTMVLNEMTPRGWKKTKGRTRGAAAGVKLMGACMRMRCLACGGAERPTQASTAGNAFIHHQA